MRAGLAYLGDADVLVHYPERVSLVDEHAQLVIPAEIRSARQRESAQFGPFPTVTLSSPSPLVEH